MLSFRSFVPLATAALLLGCSSSSSNSSSSSDKIAGLKLTQGLAPLHYVVSQGGSVTVRDMTAGKTIANGKVLPSTAISIDQTSGVSYGAKVVKKGPLPADHRYQILLDQSP